MVSFVILHYHNISDGAEAAFQEWFDDHSAAIAAVPGFRGIQRFEITPIQLKRDDPQPWKHLRVYEFEGRSALPDLRPVAAAIATGRFHKLFQDEHSHVFEMNWPLKKGPYFTGEPMTHLLLVMGNLVVGREEEYHRWYDQQHSAEVIESPGFTAMWRGRIADIQLDPPNDYPANQLIFVPMRTTALQTDTDEFIARANGVSPSGIAWGPRNMAASLQRTVHVFEVASPRRAATELQQRGLLADKN